jgi:GH15 family glucan-1,4-alpha-glucosidase
LSNIARQLGNTPQAFTHLAHVQAARLVSEGPMTDRGF